MDNKTEYQRIDESLTEKDFNEDGYYIDQNDQVHFAPWLKRATDLEMKRALQFLNDGGSANDYRA